MISEENISYERLTCYRAARKVLADSEPGNVGLSRVLINSSGDVGVDTAFGFCFFFPLLSEPFDVEGRL